MDGQLEETAPARALIGPDGGERSLLRDSAWSVLAYASSAGSALIVSILLARAYGPEDFGHYSYVLWLLRTLPTLIALGIPTALAKLAAEGVGAGKGAAARGYLRLAQRVHWLLGGLVAAVAVAIAVARPSATGLALLVVAGTFVTLFVLDYEAMITALRGFRALSVFAAVTGAAQVLATAVGLAVGLGWEGLLVVFVAVATAGLGALAVISRSHAAGLPPAALDDEQRSAFLRFAGISTFALVVDAVLWGRPELFFLERLSSSSDVGLYSAALRTASLAAVLPVVAARPLLPEFSRLRGANDIERLRVLFPRACATLLAIAAPVAAVAAGVAGPVTRAFYGSEYAAAIPVTAALLLGSVLRAATAPLASALLAGPRARSVVELGCVGIVVNLLLDVVLIARYGLAGAAAATLVAQAVWLAGAAVISWRHLGLHYPVRIIPPIAAVAAVAGAGTVAMVRYSPAWLDLAGGAAVGLSVAAIVGNAAGLPPWDRRRADRAATP